MKMRKHLSLILAAALFAVSFAGTASAVNVWDGTTGTVPQPVGSVITITTGAQLAAFRNAVNNGNDYANYTIRLGDDINLNNNEWTPIGRFKAYWTTQYNKAFKGVFDGAGHSITGLKVNNTAGNFNDRGETAALFGYIDYPSNSKAAMARSMTPADKAALDAAALGLTGEDYYRVLAERRDFYETFGVKPAPAETRSVTPSYAAKGVVKNLKVYGTVTNTKGQGAAGIVCWNDGLVENCYFEGTASCSGATRAYVGGICSLLGDNVDTTSTFVVNCVTSGDLNASGNSFSYAGGIAGYCYEMNSGYVVNCSVQPGTIIYSNMNAGGVVGAFANKVYNCSSAAGSITVSPTIIPENEDQRNYTGGIVGAYGTVYSCYWLHGGAYQPNYAIGGGTDTTGRKTTVAALPRASVLFGRKTIAVNGTAYAPKTTYPTGAAANTLSYSGWNSSDSSVAGVNSSSGLVTGYSAGKAVISATAASSGSWWSTALAGTVGVTPESTFTVTQ